MSTAFKCDRCKKFFEENSQELRLDDDDIVKELCSRCVSDLKTFLIGLAVPNAFFKDVDKDIESDE